MKIIDRYKLIKSKYPDYIVFIKNGAFYNTFYKDAIYINRLYGYKIINNMVGFPINVLSKIKCDYILVDKINIRLIKQLV